MNFDWKQFRADYYADQAEHEKSINTWMLSLGVCIGIALSMIVFGIVIMAVR